VEKNFDLGKTDTASLLCDVVRVQQTQFSSRARNRNRFRYMHKNIDFIRVFDGSEKTRHRARAFMLVSVTSTLPQCGVGAKQGRFCRRVHRPLSGVGVFSVALV
jgi:hypothetical protein